jgi:peptidoglycan biosynthesis protein MviN/MurJ (putative lipid II flippase)
MRRELISIFFINAAVLAAGFFKFRLIGRLFGIGVELDGYYLAMTLPSFVSNVASGLLQTGLFPVRARLARDSAPEAVESFERTVLAGSALFGIMMALALAGIVFTIPGRVGLDLEANTWQATAYVLPFALALLPLNMLNSATGYLLAFRGRYRWFAAAPAANALFSGSLLAAWPEGGLFNLALGTLLGLALQTGLGAWALKLGGFRFAGGLGRIGEAAQEWREMLRLGGWVLPGILLANLTASLPTVFAASYGEGAAAAFGCAWRLHTYTVQLLVMGAAPVILSRFSDLAAQDEWPAVRGLLDKALRSSALIGVAAVSGVWLAGAPVLELVFGGRFDAAASRMVAGQWQWLALALGPAILGNVLTKFFQACSKARLMSGLAAMGFGVFLAVAMPAGVILGSQAVSAAVGVSAFAVAAVSWRRMTKIMIEEGLSQ